jgi:hypothetical protein
MFNGDNYYLWYNDYYDGRLDYYPAGDVGYICAVIPEPSTIMLMAGGVIFLRRNSNKSGGINWK